MAYNPGTAALQMLAGAVLLVARCGGDWGVVSIAGGMIGRNGRVVLLVEVVVGVVVVLVVVSV